MKTHWETVKSKVDTNGLSGKILLFFKDNMKAILGKKIGMTHIFDDKGNMIPVTVIEAGPCVVTQVKTVEHEGYDATQIGFGESDKLSKPQEGHLKKAKAKSKYLQELKGKEEVKVGDKITVDLFNVGDAIQVTATSKGKGFAGVIKRHNFHRGPMSHGSHHHRAPGSIGSAFPQHVFKGTKLPGRMGNEKVTTRGLKIADIDIENNTIAIKGAVPGPKKGIVLISGKGAVAQENKEEVKEEAK